jgi:pimeloyl-ACP methyl ester carboxylesterase
VLSPRRTLSASSGPLHVIGNSLRGAVTQHLVALEPARIASLMLVTSACSGKEVALPLRLLAVPVPVPVPG